MRSSFDLIVIWTFKGMGLVLLIASVREIVSGNELIALYLLGGSILFELFAVPTQVVSEIKKAQSEVVK